MKLDRHGQAKILSKAEEAKLFADGFTSDRDRALFGICLYTGCRISEACKLLAVDVYNAIGVRAKILIRKGNTKGKQETRTVPTHPKLKAYLETYQSSRANLFPGRHGLGHIHPSSADAILRAACDRVGLEGISTHSFRRSALTRMSAAGVPLRTIQKISGHKSLNELQKYLEVSEEQVEQAIALLGE